MPTIAHFEIPADNVSRAKDFYKQMFGWKFEQMDKEMDYWSIKTGSDKHSLSGGLMKRAMKDQKPVNYVTVNSISSYLTKAEKAGGHIVAPKTAVPNMGYWAIVTDTEHNPVGLWEENPKAM